MNKEIDIHRIDTTIYTLKHVNSNIIVHKGPCLIGNVVCSGDGVAGTCDIYDGDNATTERKIHIEVIINTTFGTGAAVRGLFMNGLYVTVNATTTHVMIWYLPLSPDDVRHIQTHH